MFVAGAKISMLPVTMVLLEVMRAPRPPPLYW